MDTRKKEIIGICFEMGVIAFYLLILFVVAYLMMK